MEASEPGEFAPIVVEISRRLVRFAAWLHFRDAALREEAQMENLHAAAVYLKEPR